MCGGHGERLGRAERLEGLMGDAARLLLDGVQASRKTILGRVALAHVLEIQCGPVNGEPDALETLSLLSAHRRIS
jgi:hypothetical protein